MFPSHQSLLAYRCIVDSFRVDPARRMDDGRRDGNNIIDNNDLTKLQIILWPVHVVPQVA